MVANTGAEFKDFIDFVATVTFHALLYRCLVMKPKLEGAAYCAEKGLLDRMFYNSLTVWEKDLETEVREIAPIGVKHVLLVAFDPPTRCPWAACGTRKILDLIDKVGAKFESILWTLPL